MYLIKSIIFFIIKTKAITIKTYKIVGESNIAETIQPIIIIPKKIKIACPIAVFPIASTKSEDELEVLTKSDDFFLL